MLCSGRKILGLVGRLGALASVPMLAAIVAPAHAGTLSVQLGTTPAGCTASSWFATGMTGNAYCTNSLSIFKYGGGWDVQPDSPTVGAGAAGEWQVNAPSGITIESAFVPTIVSSNLVSSSSYGWRAGDYWAGASTIWSPTATSVTEGENNPLNSSYYGFKLWCYASSCKNNGYLDVPQVDLSATENQGPGLLAVGANNLWYQGGNWVWNPAGDRVEHRAVRERPVRDLQHVGHCLRHARQRAHRQHRRPTRSSSVPRRWTGVKVRARKSIRINTSLRAHPARSIFSSARRTPRA